MLQECLSKGNNISVYYTIVDLDHLINFSTMFNIKIHYFNELLGPADACSNTDYGKFDLEGRRCNKNTRCDGAKDDVDFKASLLCCKCGGGTTGNAIFNIC